MARVRRRIAAGLVLGAAALAPGAAAEKVSNGLGDFLTKITGREFRALGGDVWKCVDAYLPLRSELRADDAGLSDGEPPHAFLTRHITRDDGVAELTRCLLEHGAVDASFLQFYAGHVAQAAVTAAGGDEVDPVGLLRRVLPAGAASLDYTRDRSILASAGSRGRGGTGSGGGPLMCTPPNVNSTLAPALADPLIDWQRSLTDTADCYNLLHHAIAHEKTVLRHRDVQNLLFEDAKSEEYDTTSRRYSRLGKALAYAVQEADPTLALTLLQATKRLVEAPPVDYPVAAAMAAGGVRGGVPGRVMRLADKTHLDSTLNTLLAEELLAHSRRMHSQSPGDAATGLSSSVLAQVPHLGHLLSCQDRMGRTPLHIAAATDNPLVVRAIARHVAASLTSSNASDVTWRNITAVSPFLVDATGYTARGLAEAMGNAAVAGALEALEAAVTAAHPAVQHNTPRSSYGRSPLPPSVPPLPLPQARLTPRMCPNNGWGEPRFVGAKARAAVSSYRALAPSECDADVIDYSRCSVEDEAAGQCGLTPQQFFDHYFVRNRPVLLRGYSARYDAFAKWTPSYFLAAHGSIQVKTSEIPYASQWGVKGGTLPMGTYIQAMMMCDKDAAAGAGLRAAAGPRDGAGAGGGGDQCGLPAQPMVDVPKELCAAFTRDDSTFVRGVDGDDPLPSSRLYVFHSLTQASAARDEALGRLYREITPLPWVVANATLPLWSNRAASSNGGRRSPGGVGAAARVAAAGGEPSSMQLGPDGTPAPDSGSTSNGAGSGQCATRLVHHGDEVIQLYVGGPGSGAPMHYHQDAINTLLHGSKHWYLQPPSKSPTGGDSAEFGTVAIADFVTKVLPFLPEDERPLQCTQRAGDVMYVPYAWGHACFNTETSIGWATEIDTDFGRYSRL